MISYCLSTNQPKDDRAFRVSTSIISCARERAFYAMCVVDDDRYFKNKILCKFARPTREVLSTRHIWYDRRQSRHNFLLMKNPQWSRKIENGGNCLSVINVGKSGCKICSWFCETVFRMHFSKFLRCYLVL